MLSCEFLLEARRNPPLNPKQISGHSGALQYIETLYNNGNNLNSIGISMTNLSKLGVNPQSRYNTPIGIYFYPAFYYLEVKQKFEDLPFQDDARYIQIFEVPRPILYINDVGYEEYADYVKKLFTLAPKLYRKLGFDSEEEYTNFLSIAIRMAGQKARIHRYGGYLWYLTWRLAYRTNDLYEDEIEQAQTHSIVWNKIWRELGVATIIDYEGGIIHENEPSQGLVIDTSQVEIMKVFQNPRKTSDIGQLENDWRNGLIGNGEYVSLLVKAEEPIYLMRYARHRKIKSPRVERQLLRMANIPGAISAMVEYARDFYRGVGWKEAEKIIVTHGLSEDILEYAKIVRRPLPMSDDHPLFQYPSAIFKYAKATGQRISPSLEQNLKNDRFYAELYAKEILKLSPQEAKNWVKNKGSGTDNTEHTLGP